MFKKKVIRKEQEKKEKFQEKIGTLKQNYMKQGIGLLALVVAARWPGHCTTAHCHSHLFTADFDFPLGKIKHDIYVKLSFILTLVLELL